MSADSPLLELAASGATIVTRTARLARVLSRRLALQNAAAGISVAESPDIQTLGAWLETRWESLDPKEILLNPAVEKLLWEHIIEESGPDPLYKIDGLAAQAAEAWARIHQWGRPPAEKLYDTPETAAFRLWAGSFAVRLESQDWRTGAELCGLVCRAVEDGSLEVPKNHIAFAGFERLDPVLSELLDALKKAGITVSTFVLPDTEAVAPHSLAFDTALAEIHWVARDIARALEEHQDLHIGVVATDLAAYRPLFETILAEELCPASTTLSGLDQPRPFDLAGAPALSQYPLVAHALDLLRLGPRANPFELLSRILLSPYPRTQEHQDRARCEVDLRKKNLHTLGLEGLTGRLKKSGARQTALRLEALASLLADSPVKASPRQWAAAFARRLGTLGWPGPELDKTESVVFAKWRDVTTRLSLLETVEPDMSQDRALECLGGLAASEQVQAPSAGLQVQVMGLLDSAGLDFDRLYLVGLNAGAFPQRPRPHPLLLVAWQKEVGMQRASAEIELKFANSIWQRLLRSAPTIVASYPLRGDGNETLLPSPFLNPASERQTVSTAAWYVPTPAQRKAQLEPRPPETPPPARVLSGGTGLLKDQSNCPFMALASRRLHSEPLDVPAPGPNSRERGTLVHMTLETVWERLQDSRTLRASSPADLKDIVGEAAKNALAGRAGRTIAPYMQEAVLLWLGQLTLAWLNFENSHRQEEWRVASRESRAELAIGNKGLRLEGLRIDRIDELLDSGDRLLIDYKTSTTAAKASYWEGERPRDPQLQIYALARRAAGDRVADIAFANLTARDELSFNSVAKRKLLDNDILDQWQQVLDALADEYVGGQAPVAPDTKSRPCNYCGRQNLCRIFENQPGLEDEGDGETP